MGMCCTNMSGFQVKLLLLTCTAYVQHSLLCVRNAITSTPLRLQQDQIQAKIQSKHNKYAGVKIALHSCFPLSTFITISISCRNSIPCNTDDTIIALKYILWSSSSLQ